MCPRDLTRGYRPTSTLEYNNNWVVRRHIMENGAPGGACDTDPSSPEKYHILMYVVLFRKPFILRNAPGVATVHVCGAWKRVGEDVVGAPAPSSLRDGLSKS